MGKIVLDRRGDLRRGVFYSFHVPNDDDGLRPDQDWIVVARTPTNDALRAKGEEPYLWISPWGSDEGPVETKDCPAVSDHVTHSYYRKQSGETFGGNRISPLIPMDIDNSFALSDELYRRLTRLKLHGASMEEFDLQEHVTGKKLRGFWSLQFVGKARLRLPKFVDVANACPHCGQGKIGCESCGQWDPYCKACRKPVATLKPKHGGRDDKQIPIEEDPWRVIEGKTWDGSDLVQTSGGWRCFASKRFIDRLLRIHAAPFYAEPVWFCVDGMNAEQQCWFKELEKPLEA